MYSVCGLQQRRLPDPMVRFPGRSSWLHKQRALDAFAMANSSASPDFAPPLTLSPTIQFVKWDFGLAASKDIGSSQGLSLSFVILIGPIIIPLQLDILSVHIGPSFYL